MDPKRRPPRNNRNFQQLKSGITKQIKKREVADEVVTYVDSSRNIAVVLGEEDLKENLNLQVLTTCMGSEEGGVPPSDLLRREAFFHFKKKNFVHALECATRAQDQTEETDFDILILQAELELVTRDFKSALKTAGTVLRERKKSRKAIFIKAECLYNLCQFEHALIMYHKGKSFSNRS
jgi:hypothetical protein